MRFLKVLSIRIISYLSPICCIFWENFINSHKISQGCSSPRGGDTRIISAVHIYTHARPEKREKGLFLRLNAIRPKSRVGVKMSPFLRKRGHFFKLRQIFSQKKKFRVNMGQNRVKFAFRFSFGFFFFLVRGEIAFRVYFENLWSRLCIA